MPIDYAHLLTIAADTPAALRRVDVFRLLAVAHETGCLEGFCDWLSAQRPDVRDEIAVCQTEIAPSPQEHRPCHTQH